MISNMMAATDGMKKTIDYNERKVKAKTADRLAVRNLAEDSEKCIRETYARLERGNIRTENISFQMSLNPNPEKPEEALTDEEAVRMADKIMKDLGYENQPYVVYKHHDIDRVHYHIMSCRVKPDGHAIDSFGEIRKLKKMMLALQKEFHFTLGDGKTKKETYTKAERFDLSKGNVTGQIDAIMGEALKYHFENPAQFATILERAGLKVKEAGIDKLPYFIIQGLDKRNKPCTTPLSERELGKDYYAQMQARLEENKQKKLSEVLPNKNRLKTAIAYALRHAKDAQHFENILAKIGIDVSFARSKDTNEIFGVTFIDHQSKVVIKGTDIHRELTGNLFREAEAEGTWPKPYVKEERGESERTGFTPSLVPSFDDEQKNEQENYEEDERQEQENNVFLDIITILAANSGGGGRTRKPRRPKKPKKEISMH